jgi:predicted DsbA family dithiol-disulfide isomerase
MNKNDLLCDIKTGICGSTEKDTNKWIDFSTPNEKIEPYYFTDPICSHCWALEPVLRKFAEQYSPYFNFHTVMGGLLESWNGFADKKNGIKAPADVADHWREVGTQYRMPIDGSVWLTNPLDSSYPPSRVFTRIKQNDVHLANTFLRRAREAVFVFNQNIAEEHVLIDIVNQVGLDGKTIVNEANMPIGDNLLNQDFALAGKYGVSGFPTIIMVNQENKGVKIVGTRNIETYVNGLKQILPADKPMLPTPPQPLAVLLEREKRLFSIELESLYELHQQEIHPFIQKELDSFPYKKKQILGEWYIEKI